MFGLGEYIYYSYGPASRPRALPSFTLWCARTTSERGEFGIVELFYSSRSRLHGFSFALPPSLFDKCSLDRTMIRPRQEGNAACLCVGLCTSFACTSAWVDASACISPVGEPGSMLGFRQVDWQWLHARTCAAANLQPGLRASLCE